MRHKVMVRHTPLQLQTMTWLFEDCIATVQDDFALHLDFNIRHISILPTDIYIRTLLLDVCIRRMWTTPYYKFGAACRDAAYLMMKSGTKLCYSNIHTYMDLQRFDLDKNFFTPHEERRPKLEMLHMVMMSKAILMSNSVINCPNSRHLGSMRREAAYEWSTTSIDQIIFRLFLVWPDPSHSKTEDSHWRKLSFDLTHS